jgi:GTPase
MENQSVDTTTTEQKIEEAEVTNKLDNEVYSKAIDLEDEDAVEQVKSCIEWSLRQGHGEMLFEVGGKNGLTEEECDLSVKNLIIIADKLNCDSTVVCEKKGKEGKSSKSVDVLIRERDAEKYCDIRIAVCGNVDAGKSTLVGVLNSG